MVPLTVVATMVWALLRPGPVTLKVTRLVLACICLLPASARYCCTLLAKLLPSARVVVAATPFLNTCTGSSSAMLAEASDPVERDDDVVDG